MAEAFTPLAVTAFIAFRAVLVLLTLGYALSSNTGLPIQTITFSWCICTIYVTWPVTHWSHWKLIARVEGKSPLVIAHRIVLPTRSTFKQTGLVAWSTLPKSAAVCIVRVVVWLLDFRVNKLSAVWHPATIICETLFARMSPRRPGGAHLT